MNFFLEIVRKETKKIVLDQLILPYNRSNFFKLFDNLKQIIVDRDPRDVYLDAMTYNAYPITKDIESFISFYESTHLKEIVKPSDTTLLVKFEDLIYNYEQTVNMIFEFLNIQKNDHTRIKKYFNPNFSIKNTQTWMRPENKIFQDDIVQIEKKLGKWCYDFNLKK